MFCSRFRFAAKIAAVRRRNTSASAAAAVKARPRGKKSVLVSADEADGCSVRFGFNTVNLAKLASRELPKRVNVWELGHISGDAAEILNLVLAREEEVGNMMIRCHMDHHPLFLLVRTSLRKEEAEISEVVLDATLPQRMRFLKLTVIVLPSRPSSKLLSILREHKGRVFTAIPPASVPDRPELETVNVALNVEEDTFEEKNAAAQKTDIDDNNKDEEDYYTKEGVRATEDTVTADDEAKRLNKSQKKEGIETVVAEKSISAPKNRGRKRKPSQDVIEFEKMMTSLTRQDDLHRIETEDVVREMFRSSLALPFQPPQQLEKELFTGCVDRVLLGDMLSLPLFGEGDIQVLYYRLTGVGSLRTPLITITPIMSEMQRKQEASEAREAEKVSKTIHFGGATEASDAPVAATKFNKSTEPVPLLLLLSAPSIMGEAARLLCQEYQKVLQEELKPAGSLTVVVAPQRFDEKDILFVLRTSRVDGATESDAPHKDADNDMWCGDGSLLKRGKDAVRHSMRAAPSRHTLSEALLKDIVFSAVEDVALRHEKSTDHLVSTLSKLVAYWSRERVIELMDTLHGERDAMLEATKQFDEVVLKLRDTRETLKALQKDVKSMSESVESQTAELHARDGSNVSGVLEAFQAFQTRVVQELSTAPTREQISLDVRKEVGEAQKFFHESVDTAIKQHLTPLQAEEREAVISEIKQIDQSRMNELKALQGLPDQITAAVEQALHSITQQSNIDAAKITAEQRELFASHLALLQEEIRETAENGQTRMQDALSGFLSANAEKAKIEVGKLNLGDASDPKNGTTNM